MRAKTHFGEGDFMPERAAMGAAKGTKDRGAHATIPERRARSFRAYLDVLDTAAWFRNQVARQLGQFGLNLERFRVLELLRSEGPMTMSALVERRCSSKQALFLTTKGLAKRGLVQIEIIRTPATEGNEASMAKSQRGRKRPGRHAAMLSLTEEGRAFTDGVLRRHAKLVFALMRAVDLRDVDKLSETCRRIREGDPFRLIQELMMEDVD